MSISVKEKNFDIKPYQNVEAGQGDHVWRGTGQDPIFVVSIPLRKNRWYQIEYEADIAALFGRLECSFDYSHQGSIGTLLPAPVFGRQIGFFYAPENYGRFFLRLRTAAQLFKFKVNCVTAIQKLSLLWRAFGRDRHNLSLALGAGLIGAHEEFQQAFRFACGGLSPVAIGSWWAERGLSPFSGGVVLDSQASRLTDRDHSLSFQIVDRGGITPSDLADEQKICFVFHRGAVRDVLGCAPDVIKEVVRQNPDAEFIIPDETLKMFSDGQVTAAHIPVMPSRLNLRSFPERFNSVIVTPRGLRRLTIELKKLNQIVFEDVMELMTEVYQYDPNTMMSLQTPLLVFDPVEIKKNQDLSDAIERPVVTPIDTGLPFSIIIPTRNNFQLLKACIESIWRFETNEASLMREIIIVDNGSDAYLRAVYQDLITHWPGLRVIDRPGPFNFSALCNDGAAQASSRAFIFLNDDTELIEQGSLSRLTFWLNDRRVGAVGPCLLYPNHKVQHAGIVTGMGGIADHVLNGIKRDDPRFVDVLARPREVSAITGACIAMRADVFQAMKGFDDLNLPVECNDVDLCLRLREIGYEIIVDPRINLIHHQSASRGFSIRPFQRYHQERTYFRQRWREAILDDPFYHRAYSLFSTLPSLDD